jgi:ubiquitin-protein ligase
LGTGNPLFKASKQINLINQMNRINGSWSLWLDLKIILMTIWRILKREGINQPGQATMEEFMGSEQRSEI